VPATFKIEQGGSLSPPTVSSPAGFAVALTLADRDGKPHRVVVKTPTPLMLTVPAHGYVYSLLSRLPKGTYPIDVDGSARGALVVGASPGP
jgi:hypothetical protein